MKEINADQSAEKIVQTLAVIASEIGRFAHARNVHLKSTHGRFNLFTTLLNAHDEVRLHTRYLTHLLDPKGSHDCGGVFLDSFLATVEAKAVRLKNDKGRADIKFSDLKAKKCGRVSNEYCTSGLGNIDIYLEFESAVLVIENKIWAGDQPEQLQRYAEFAKKQSKAVFLFYLTLNGSSPSEHSQGILAEDDFALISYRDDILGDDGAPGWLEKCLQETYSFVNINQALQQYAAVVKQLLGSTLEGDDMSKIKEEIRNRPEIIQVADQIHRALRGVEADIINSFFAGLLDVLSDAPQDFVLKQERGDFSDPAHCNKNVWLHLAEEVILEYRPKEKHLFVGAFPGIDRKNEFHESIGHRLSSVNPNITLGSWWGMECWLQKDERSFGNGIFLAEMMDEDRCENEVRRCAEEICRFVDLVQEVSQGK